MSGTRACMNVSNRISLAQALIKIIHVLYYIYFQYVDQFVDMKLSEKIGMAEWLLRLPHNYVGPGLEPQEQQILQTLQLRVKSSGVV